MNTCPETFNLRVRAARKLHRHQQRFSTNMWAGIVGECLVDPHVLPHRLAGNHYRDFLLHDLPELQESVPLPVRARMWYMRDGAPWCARCSHYHDRWRGRGGPTAWPPRSPDLNPLDFYLCWHLNPFVHATPFGSEEALHNRIVDACQNIRNCPGISERIRLSVMRRVEACPESHGGHFEHLL
jgi:hypothetical protein